MVKSSPVAEQMEVASIRVSVDQSLTRYRSHSGADLISELDVFIACT